MTSPVEPLAVGLQARKGGRGWLTININRFINHGTLLLPLYNRIGISPFKQNRMKTCSLVILQPINENVFSALRRLDLRWLHTVSHQFQQKNVHNFFDDFQDIDLHFTREKLQKQLA